MKKFNKLFLPLILISTSLTAGDKLYSFIGIQGASSKIDSSNVPTIGFKYGKQSKQTRTTITYNYGEKSKLKYQTLLLQIDTGVFKNSFRNVSLKPYIGATVGLLQENNKHTSIRDRGYVYGPNAGLTYIMNDAFDFDLGYKYLKTSKLNNISEINDVTLSMHYFY